MSKEVPDAQPFELPMPGHHLGGSVVVASVYYRDDEVSLSTLLLVNDAPPYFTVGTGGWNQDGTYDWQWSVDHMNIVPAVEEYKDNGGDY